MFLFWISVSLLVLETLALFWIIYKTRKLIKGPICTVEHHPVVLICQVNGRVGVVLKKDFELASFHYWDRQSKLLHQMSVGGTRVSGNASVVRQLVEPMFVFSSESEFYKFLLSKCFVERGDFRVGQISESAPREFAKAYKHFFGETFSAESLTAEQVELLKNEK